MSKIVKTVKRKKWHGKTCKWECNGMSLLWAARTRRELLNPYNGGISGPPAPAEWAALSYKEQDERRQSTIRRIV